MLDYTNSLTPSQQLKVRAPATSDDCVRILKEHRGRKKAFTRILQFFEPLIHTLKRLEGAIDVVVQVNAGIASPIWGPLRLAIDVGDVFAGRGKRVWCWWVWTHRLPVS